MISAQKRVDDLKKGKASVRALRSAEGDLAEADLEKAQGLRRTARADRSRACAAGTTGPTTGVTTLGQ